MLGKYRLKFCNDLSCLQIEERHRTPLQVYLKINKERQEQKRPWEFAVEEYCCVFECDGREEKFNRLRDFL